MRSSLQKTILKRVLWASGPFLGNFNPLWCVKLETKNAWKHEPFQSLVRRNYLWCYYTYLKTDLISTWIDLIISLEWQVPILPRHFRMVKLFWQLFCPQTEPDFSDLLLTYLNVTQLKWVMIIACASRQIAARMYIKTHFFQANIFSSRVAIKANIISSNTGSRPRKLIVASRRFLIWGLFSTLSSSVDFF